MLTLVCSILCAWGLTGLQVAGWQTEDSGLLRLFPLSFHQGYKRQALMEQARYAIILVFHCASHLRRPQRQEDFIRRDQDEGSPSHQHLRGARVSDQHMLLVRLFSGCRSHSETSQTLLGNLFFHYQPKYFSTNQHHSFTSLVISLPGKLIHLRPFFLKSLKVHVLWSSGQVSSSISIVWEHFGKHIRKKGLITNIIMRQPSVSTGFT